MVIYYSARSHKGCVREHNEDNLCANGELLPPRADKRGFSMDGRVRPPCLFAVCDGMGGTERGELASFLAVQTLAQRRETLLAANGSSLEAEVAETVKAADSAVRAQCGSEESAGTTLSLAVVTRRDIRCFNLGDSRIYQQRGENLVQVTHDHTWLTEHMEQERPLRPESFLENMHKLTRCIGVGPPCLAEAYPPLQRKGRLLLCSDGLTDMLTAREIGSVLAEHRETAEASEALLALSLEKGGYDNVTVIVVDFVSERFPRLD